MSNLAVLLKNRGKRLIDLARKLEVDKATASRWAKTKVPSERLIDIEREFGIPPCDLRPDLASVFTSSKVKEGAQ